jgi:hypothetical protein
MAELRSVLIRGDGIAAACCAHLLRDAGIAVRIERSERPKAPALLVSDPALALMRDVFGRPDLLGDRPRISRRVVAWGQPPASLPHSGTVVSEAELVESLTPAYEPADQGEPDFVLHTTGGPPAGAVRRHFGARTASAAMVRLSDPADADACWIEAVAEGWLFLVPAQDATWLLAIGAPFETLLTQSRLIGRRVEVLREGVRQLDAGPRIVAPAAGDGWLACGSTAIGFDPICGDGTAQAVRAAILASAVLAAIAEGGDRDRLLKHYDLALAAAMRRHLGLCAHFYRSGGEGPWWRAALDDLRAGHNWCTGQLAHAGDPAFELRDFRLLSRELAA